MTRSLDNRGETEALAGAADSPLGPPSGRSAEILLFPVPSAAASWDAGESELDEDVFPLGSLAVRMVADFKRPRILVWSQAPGSEEEEAGSLL